MSGEYEIGYDDGYDDGYELGYEAGREFHEEGYKEGQSSFSNKLTKIANTVASSSDCRHCAIKDFCQTVSDSSLCEYVWSEWISKQLEN